MDLSTNIQVDEIYKSDYNIREHLEVNKIKYLNAIHTKECIFRGSRTIYDY